MNMLQRLLNENLSEWMRIVAAYETDNRRLLVPADNSVETLHVFNVEINNLYTNAYYDYARARRNKDAIDRFLDAVLKDRYSGANEAARRGAAIEKAKEYPFNDETIDLFELQDVFHHLYLMMDATIQTLKAKADSKVTNNSLLKLEKSII
jgi:hypothetical protein